MAKRIAVMLAEGFEEIETVTVVDILRRAGGRVSLISLFDNTESVKGSRGVYFVPDSGISVLSDADFDAIVLPGGLPGTTNLHADKTVKDTLLRMNSDGKLIASICAATSILADYGITSGKNATSHPAFKEQTDINDTIYSDERVVVDGNIVTSRSPGTAMEFAFALVEQLYGSEMVEKVNAGVLARL